MSDPVICKHCGTRFSPADSVCPACGEALVPQNADFAVIPEAVRILPEEPALPAAEAQAIPPAAEDDVPAKPQHLKRKLAILVPCAALLCAGIGYYAVQESRHRHVQEIEQALDDFKADIAANKFDDAQILLDTTLSGEKDAEIDTYLSDYLDGIIRAYYFHPADVALTAEQAQGIDALGVLDKHKTAAFAADVSDDKQGEVTTLTPPEEVQAVLDGGDSYTAMLRAKTLTETYPDFHPDKALVESLYLRAQDAVRIENIDYAREQARLGEYGFCADILTDVVKSFPDGKDPTLDKLILTYTQMKNNPTQPLLDSAVVSLAQEFDDGAVNTQPYPYASSWASMQFAFQGDFVYFFDNGAIYRANQDFTQPQKLLEVSVDIREMQIQGSDLFFTTKPGYLYRYNTAEGTLSCLLKEPVYGITVDGDTLYYETEMQTESYLLYQLHTLTLSTMKQTLVTDQPLSLYLVADGKVFFSSQGDCTFYCCNTDGTDLTLLSGSINATSLHYSDGTLVITADMSSIYTLAANAISPNKLKLLYEYTGISTSGAVKFGDTVYAEAGGGSGFYAIDKSGQAKTIVSFPNQSYGFFPVGDCLYYYYYTALGGNAEADSQVLTLARFDPATGANDVLYQWNS
ncbi:MAG: DUF5050 domain-containing protein [Oscillospiraceae bacterium]